MKDFSNVDNCPVRNVLDRLSDKWTTLIILVLGEYGTLRFSELRGHISDVSEKMLTVSLRKLEADGLILRKVYPVIPPKVEYKLTTLGQDFLPLINSISDWAYQNMGQILENREHYQK